ncbi:MAG: D-alanine--D-alanine ligase [Patescibacteria group bacterium]
MKIAFTYNIQLDPFDIHQAEFDTPETINFIKQTLTNLGHSVILIDAISEIEEIISALKEIKPDIIFNTAEGTIGKSREGFFPLIFEQLGIPFIGSDSYTCTVTLDKNLTKIIVEKFGIKTPKYLFVRSLDDLENFNIQFPVILKPNFEGSSKGITSDSIIENFEGLVKKTQENLKTFPDGILIEEYIHGKDLTVPFIQSISPKTKGILMPCEYDFPTINERYKIYDYNLKNITSDNVSLKVATETNEKVLQKIFEYGQKIVSVLNIKDFGRMDFRLSDSGELYFIEINALPCLQNGASMYVSANFAGIEKEEDVIKIILENAMSRYNLVNQEVRKEKIFES